MTIFLLHGGKTSQQNSQNENFFKQFTELVSKDEVTVLLCYFARAKEKWDALIERDSNSIKNNTIKKVNILIAEDPKDLLLKVDKADVLYVAGGDEDLIEPVYKDLAGLEQKLKGKVYAGCSMGAFMASEQYVLSPDGQDTKTVHKGLGLLQVQVLYHWNIEQEKVRKINLLAKSSDSPVIVLNEFETVTIYNNKSIKPQSILLS